MVADKIKELSAVKARVAELEQAVAGELKSELASLPSRYGFETAAAFIAAVKTASGGKKRSRKAAGGGRKQKRARITDETRAQVKKLVAEKKTGAEIAKAVSISLPSVQNIKKALGLVKARK